MMDLQELRIQRTPVTPNSKCEGCVHYDGNAAAKGGACEVGTAPALCGSGIDRKYGYAPLAELGPDEIDDLATPCVNGSPGTMNEYGSMEPMIQMKRVTLGDEDMTIAQRIAGDITRDMVKSEFRWQSQGEVSRHCGQEMADRMRDGKPLPLAYRVAKSLRDMHFAPRKQRKYDLEDVLDFLKAGGMHVGEDAYEAAGIEKGTKPDWVYGKGGQKAPPVVEPSPTPKGQLAPINAKPPMANSMKPVVKALLPFVKRQ